MSFLLRDLKTGIYNAGFENKKIIQIAKNIQNKIECEIKIEASNDPRSYRLNSDKLLNVGFKPYFGINDAINEIAEYFKSKKLIDKKNYYNINWLKKSDVK